MESKHGIIIFIISACVIYISCSRILQNWIHTNNTSTDKASLLSSPVIHVPTPTKIISLKTAGSTCANDEQCGSPKEAWCMYDSCVNIAILPPQSISGNYSSYQSSEAGFTISFPSSWQIGKILLTADNDQRPLTQSSRGVIIKGIEGFIELLWGTGFGGGCDKWETITIGNEKYPVCHLLRPDGSEDWRMISKNLKTFSFVMNGHANNPAPSKRYTILSIMSSLKFD
jgi:hypothetical protein